MQLQDSIFIVTGGASGLGEATVRAFHGAGAKVVIADVGVAKGEALAAELGEGVAFCKTDITSEAEAQAAVDLAVSRFGGLHGLINCAGVGPAWKMIGKDGPHPLDAFARTVNINLVGAFNMIRLAAVAMAKGEPNAEGERGVIINTASIAAFEGQIGQAAYAASKAGLIGLTMATARELASRGVTCNAISPGYIETDMTAESLPEAARAKLMEQIPLGRIGRPDDVADIAAFLAGPEAGYITGQVLRVNGGMLM